MACKLTGKRDVPSGMLSLFTRSIITVSVLIPAILAVLTGCSSTETPIVKYLPVQNTTHDINPLGAIEGTLIVEDGYVLVARNDAGNQTLLPIWPYRYSFKVTKGIVEIKDKEGAVVARIGDHVVIGSGEASDSIVNSLVVQSIPEDCHHTRWLVGGTILNRTLELEQARNKLGLTEK